MSGETVRKETMTTTLDNIIMCVRYECGTKVKTLRLEVVMNYLRGLCGINEMDGESNDSV